MARSGRNDETSGQNAETGGRDAERSQGGKKSSAGAKKIPVIKSEDEIAKDREKKKKRLIAAELKKLETLFSPLGEKEREFLQPLLENAAFMRVTLDELQKEINLTGAVESYQNGAAQHGVKVSSNIQAYNQLMKTYHALMDKLLSRLPVDQRQRDGLDQFRL